MLKIDQFPNIRKAYVEMVYANGGVYNGMGRIPSRTEGDALAASEPVMTAEGVYDDDLAKLDEWLGTLSDDQILCFVDGEETERDALEATCPTGGPDNVSLGGLFNDLFDVC